ncbi:transposase [Candidatus Roizmanbacteria bacterium CG_4_9_14_0_2_um_filter_36_12]|uniref:Transposase n=2 Tax=Candidatus Roizmaniibacteriota TaxID=1752723 RepID=A0A2M8EXL7_9BACT|nr:MAG: transposase [Candidatus Roizmanbacteria bacterium CG_4_9_14_0_2_um_filter_36_12]
MVKTIRQRKPNRLKNFDYSSSGWYFVTICTKNRQEYFGKIVNNKMVLNEYGRIVEKCYLDLINHYSNCLLDVYQIMPNHIHGIIIIKNKKQIINVGTIHELSLQKEFISDWKQRRHMLLPIIIGFFKMNSSKSIHNLGLNSFQWQRSFYDHIIRNEKSLQKIRQYIQDNPKNWQTDRNNLSFKP